MYVNFIVSTIEQLSKLELCCLALVAAWGITIFVYTLRLSEEQEKASSLENELKAYRSDNHKMQRLNQNLTKEVFNADKQIEFLTSKLVSTNLEELRSGRY